MMNGSCLQCFYSYGNTGVAPVIQGCLLFCGWSLQFYGQIELGDLSKQRDRDD